MDISSVYPYNEQESFSPEGHEGVILMTRAIPVPNPMNNNFRHLDQFIIDFDTLVIEKKCIESFLCFIKPDVYEKLARLNSPHLNIEYKNNVTNEILAENRNFNRNQFENLSVVKICLIACIFEVRGLSAILDGKSAFLEYACNNIDRLFRDFNNNKNLIQRENSVNWFFRNIIELFIEEVNRNGIRFEEELPTRRFK